MNNQLNEFNPFSLNPYEEYNPIAKQLAFDNKPTVLKTLKEIEHSLYRSITYEQRKELIDQIKEEVVLEFTARLTSETLQDVTIEYPADWWQAVKLRFAPKWYLNRYPAKMTTQTVKVKAIYPTIPFERQPSVMLVEKSLDSRLLRK